MNQVVGVDPGLTGAVSILWVDSGRVEVVDMPVMPRPSGKGNMVNYADMRDIEDLFVAGYKSAVFIEDVHAMPGQGVTSVFSFGRSLGVIEGVFAQHEIEYVRPQKWKKHFGLLNKNKDDARLLAIELYPQLESKLKRKKDIGRADALLIMRYGQDTLNTGDKPEQWRRIL
jgi:crossover junction endodeoxyribonuclease RuvC